MQIYTIGALFNENIDSLVLIKKVKPEWQAGLYNFPGGGMEPEDQGDGHRCISREFNEETGILIQPKGWIRIGEIVNANLDYRVYFLTAKINNETAPITVLDHPEVARWVRVHSYVQRSLPMVSNLSWLIPFAMNIHQQGNYDNLEYGIFRYE